MKIDQAIYGLGNGGHSLLQWSGNREVFREVERRMDLPNTAPHGIPWSPYLSGFGWKDYYVLSKTELDPRAARGGVVFTRALLFPIEEISTSKKIGPFVEFLLERSIDNTEVLTPLEIEHTGEEEPQPHALVAVVNALSSRGAGPGVWIGLEGFSQAVVALWNVLWPELRRSLSFRLSFGPDDLIEKPPPNLIVTPQGLAAKWTKGNVIDQSSATIKPSALTAALLDPEHAESLRKIAHDYGLRVNSFQDLFLVQQLQRSLELDEFTAHLSSLRIIETLSLSAAVGRQEKSKLLSRLLARLPLAEAQQWLLLRNFKMTRVENVESLWKSLEDCVAESSFSQRYDPRFLEIIKDSLTGSASIEAWSKAIENGFVHAARRPSGHLLTAAWRWADLKPNLGEALFSILPDDIELEGKLLAAIPPTVTEAVGLVLTPVCSQRKWIRLHGAISNRAFGAREAIRRQLAVDSDVRFSGGLLLAIGKAPDIDVIEAAIAHDDDRLMDAASQRVSVHPGALRSFDFALYAVQKIWSGAIFKSTDSWKAPTTPSDTASVIFDKLIEADDLFLPLIDAFARTPLCDVTSYHRRSLLWEKLNAAQKEAFLGATAKGFIDQLVAGLALERPEALLEKAILDSEQAYEKFVGPLQTQPDFLPTLASTFLSFNEKHLERLLDRLVRSVPSIPMSVSQSLGTYVRSRDWRQAAEWMLARLTQGRNDLRPALTQCADLFSWLTRFRYQLATVSSDQKWVAFREVASTLYPSGPDHHDIWERSGGKNRELEHNGGGEWRWTAAINRMRNGNGVHAGRLLHEMKQEFPMNEELRFLADDIEFGGWRR